MTIILWKLLGHQRKSARISLQLLKYFIGSLVSRVLSYDTSLPSKYYVDFFTEIYINGSFDVWQFIYCLDNITIYHADNKSDHNNTPFWKWPNVLTSTMSYRACLRNETYIQCQLYREHESRTSNTTIFHWLLILIKIGNLVI